MGKVIESKDLNKFIETGEHQVIQSHKSDVKTEPKKEEKLLEKPVSEQEAKEPIKGADPDPDGNNMPEDTIDSLRLKVNKKHRALEAEKALRIKYQEERDENERLAESQFNERRLVESERDKFKRELEELKMRASPVKEEPAIKEPDEGDPIFKDDKGNFDWKKFTKAQADYAVERFKAEESAKAASAERVALEKKVSERIEVAKSKYPDFLEVLEAQGERKDVPGYIMQFLFESDQGPDIAYYFAKNREELTKISQLSPIKALARLGKLETRFEPKVEETPKVEKVEPTAERTSTAPPPIVPISASGAGTVTVDPSKMDFRQLRAFEREKNNKRKG